MASRKLTGQSRKASATEAVLNVGSGFLLSFVLWQTIGPFLGYSVSYADNFVLTSIFTVASITRTYVWRRAFNWYHHRSPA